MKSLIDFPCDFPIKIMASHRDGVIEKLLAIVRKHHPELLEQSIKQQFSKNKNYVSVTITVKAQSQATLDALYLELTQHSDIKMVL